MRGTWYDEEVGERIATGALRPRNDRDEGDGTKGAGKPSIESTGAIYRKNEDGGGGSAGRSESEAEDSCGTARLYLRGGALLSAKKRADCARGKHTAATRGEVKEKLT